MHPPQTPEGWADVSVQVDDALLVRGLIASHQKPTSSILSSHPSPSSPKCRCATQMSVSDTTHSAHCSAPPHTALRPPLKWISLLCSPLASPLSLSLLDSPVAPIDSERATLLTVVNRHYATLRSSLNLSPVYFLSSSVASSDTVNQNLELWFYCGRVSETWRCTLFSS